MSEMLVRVQEKGQVTIPSRIRKKLKLKKGDLVIFEETETGAVIKPAEVLVADVLDQIGKALQDKGITLDEIIERGRELRGDLIASEYNLEDASGE
ncbi:MAG: AbrB/MazE/SpoVT family DNA-binding domain-containing protein [Chloroflexota bacterium]